VISALDKIAMKLSGYLCTVSNKLMNEWNNRNKGKTNKIASRKKNNEILKKKNVDERRV